MISKTSLLAIALFNLLGFLIPVSAGADTVAYRIHPDRALQVIKGLGFEIQSDSIGSGNQGLPENRIAVPHDLVPAERQRLSDEMLRGFRYCRLAGGLYWRGLDAEGKQLRPRWPGQLEEIRDMLGRAGVEGLSFEYWSPAPYWKANGRYVARSEQDPENTLRCFGPNFSNDPIYQGDVDRFLMDFAQAVVGDIKTLKGAGLKVSMWGLQNEPYAQGAGYSKCPYFKSSDYLRAYKAVASAIRQHDASILLFSDTESGFPHKIAPGMTDPTIAALVDAYVVHTIGAPSENVRKVHAEIRSKLPLRPWFQNEYEYLTGGATPERCLNTVRHIMNSFQLAENPTWFWIHALKPFRNAEASGYSLGFWRSLEEPATVVATDEWLRWYHGPEIAQLPRELAGLEMISATRGQPDKPGREYTFSVNQPVWLNLLVEQWGEYSPGEEWEKTGLTVTWSGGHDQIYRRQFPAGQIAIPQHTGNEQGRYGAPHLVFLEPSEPATFKAMIGINVPIQIRSEALALERAAAALEPGHWIYNPYNWNAVGSFVKRLPWDSVAIATEETDYQADARIFTFKKPDGKLTVVVANSSGRDHRFDVGTGLPAGVWLGYRYTPEEAGAGTLGIPVGRKTGPRLALHLPHLSWEFWEQQ